MGLGLGWGLGWGWDCSWVRRCGVAKARVRAGARAQKKGQGTQHEMALKWGQTM